MADERRDRTRKAPSLRSGSTDVSARRSAVPSRSAGMSGSSGSRTRGQYASTGTQSGATRPRYARPESDSLEGSGSPSRKIAKNGALKTQTKRTVSKKRRKKRTRLNYKAILKLAALLLAIVFIILIICNRFVIKISMNGDSEVTVKYGENYSDAGAEAVYKGTIFGFIKRGINVDTISSVDTGKPGDYEVRYSAVYKKAEGEALRTVHVVDDVPPEIILGNTEITTVKGLSWDESYMATDNADGDITSRVKVSGDVDMDTPGTYTATGTGRNGDVTVTMTFDDTDIATKTFRVTGDNINIANAPAAYSFKTVTKRMDITVAGPIDELETLDVDDIIVTADLLNYNTEQSTSFSWTPVITFYRQNESDKYRFWAVGSYSVALDRVEEAVAEE